VNSQGSGITQAVVMLTWSWRHLPARCCCANLIRASRKTVWVHIQIAGRVREARRKRVGTCMPSLMGKVVINHMTRTAFPSIPAKAQALLHRGKGWQGGVSRPGPWPGVQVFRDGRLFQRHSEVVVGDVADLLVTTAFEGLKTHRWWCVMGWLGWSTMKGK
jgi:hypothetical protein